MTTDGPILFRLDIEVDDLEGAIRFYRTLFGQAGRRQAGSRIYFDCGPVTLQVVDVSSTRDPNPARTLYFTVPDLDVVYERASSLDCLSREAVHGAPAGSISVRPWGERSFYAKDRWGTPLCFVEEGTIYPG